MRKEIDQKKCYPSKMKFKKYNMYTWSFKKKHVMINYGSHLSKSLQKAFTTLIDTKYL